jgi:Family of unknown function (DUF5329)
MFTCNLQAATTAEVNTEIQQLLQQLEVSGCQFNRNGTWYSSAEAKTHLLRKLDYLNRKGSLNNTEQFIELAASKSSSTGKPYLVKCDNNASNSQIWLTNTLSQLRKQSK